MSIINSILDTDFYKLTMQNFVLRQYPEAIAEYIFIDRDSRIKFTKSALAKLKKEVNSMSKLRLTDVEYDWIKENIPFFDPLYRQYLSNYRFNPAQVEINLDSKGFLKINIKGKWRDTILWEVPLMAIISEIWFSDVDKDWTFDKERQKKIANSKISRLRQGTNGIPCVTADFSTRRRRSYLSQLIVVEEMSKYDNFVGTSNPHFAMKFGVKALGTIAHECIQAVSALEGLLHANRFAMDKWEGVYNADLGTALPDTFGLDAFLNDFDLKHAKTWDGVRHDSGDPFNFIDKIVAHYKKLGIDPTTKTIIFSDSLNEKLAIEIAAYCQNKIRCAFGIGTYFSNDFLAKSTETVPANKDCTMTYHKKSPALNMVIKLWSINGIYVVKLSDSATKIIGQKDAVRVALWTFKGVPLDQK